MATVLLSTVWLTATAGLLTARFAAFTVLRLAPFLGFALFLLRFVQKPHVVLGMLLEILCRNPVAGQLRIARQLIVLVDHLLRCATHFALRPVGIKHTVYDVTGWAVAVRFRPRT